MATSNPAGFFKNKAPVSGGLATKQLKNKECRHYKANWRRLRIPCARDRFVVLNPEHTRKTRKWA
ncbi:hypothetical protein [Thiomicrorhabdus cannonii]|uniref:hypothetical protein n=1 Tax=Thiomicrorhabdus cannonii TaxID=2748011 RepID=UPI0015BD60AD|nr:hypothetical protein [Thiomicrorhabdus cannonii]